MEYFHSSRERLGGLLAVPIAAAANVVFTDLYAARTRAEGAAEPEGSTVAPDGAVVLR